MQLIASTHRVGNCSYKQQRSGAIVLDGKENGRSTTIRNGGVVTAEVRATIAPVAAAASVPSSLTSTKVLWITSEINAGSRTIRVKSARPLKAIPRPKALRVCLSCAS